MSGRRAELVVGLGGEGRDHGSIIQEKVRGVSVGIVVGGLFGEM